MSRAREEHGFSLIEMVVVCAILGVVLAGITTVFAGGSHAELNMNNRFQAQQAARLAITALRADAHVACAANVPTAATLVLALTPTSLDLTTCGAAHTAAYPKVVWCALASPTVTGQYALYRSTPTTDSSCTTANGKLVADNLTSNTIFTTVSPIPVGQLETFTANMTVSRKTGTAGAPYTLSEPLTLRNTVYEIGTSSVACSLTDSTVCTAATCPYLGSSTTACYAATIQ